VPFLDLDEELESLGYGNEVGERELRAGGFRFVGTEPDEFRRASKARSARAAYRKAKGERRRYRRHSPGTPRHLKCDVERRRERARAYAKKKRDAAREEATRMKNARFEWFLLELKRMELEGAAKMICVGRAVLDDSNDPDLRALFDGKDHHEREARVDFFVFLRNPLRRFSVHDVAHLFKIHVSDVDRLLAPRKGAAGVK
jgi:hypothetical protein